MGSYGYIGQFQMLFCYTMFFYVSPGIWELFVSGKSPNDYTDKEEYINRQGMTVYYWTLVLGQIAAAMCTTTELQSVFGLGGEAAYGFPNVPLNCMFLAEVALGLAAIYVGPMQSAFGTAWLPTSAVVWPVVGFAGICAIEEVRKMLSRAVEGRAR